MNEQTKTAVLGASHIAATLEREMWESRGAADYAVADGKYRDAKAWRRIEVSIGTGRPQRAQDEWDSQPRARAYLDRARSWERSALLAVLEPGVVA